MDFQAPRIIVPENCADPKCAAMIVDLGHFTLHTDTADSTDTKCVPRSLPNGLSHYNNTIFVTRSNEIDEQYFYDKFHLNLNGFTALVLPDRSVPLDMSNTESVTQAALVERFDLSFIVELVNVNTPDIPKIK